MRHLFVCVAAALAACPLLPAQVYESDFELLNGSPAGVLLTGQDGYYNPVAGSSDWSVYQYPGNSLNLPQNLLGGGQFIAGTSQGGTAYGRAQRAVAFRLGHTMRAAVDVCCSFNGTLPTAQNLGSFSLQPTTTNASFIMLATWTDVNTATNWNADLIYCDPAGTQVQSQVPDPAFQNLPVNQWYRWEVIWDFGSKLILEIRLTDLLTFTTWSHAPSSWYLYGGAAGLPLPTDVRGFAGGALGNIFAIDNLSIAPAALYTPFGRGCPGSAGTPALAAAAGRWPGVGTVFVAALSNLNASANLAFVLTGFSSTSWPPFTLPLDLAQFGMPGCTLYTDPLLTSLVLGSGGSAQWNLTIPANPVLLGVRFLNQALAYDPGANAMGLTSSNAAAGTLGR